MGIPSHRPGHRTNRSNWLTFTGFGTAVLNSFLSVWWMMSTPPTTALTSPRNIRYLGITGPYVASSKKYGVCIWLINQSGLNVCWSHGSEYSRASFLAFLASDYRWHIDHHTISNLKPMIPSTPIILPLLPNLSNLNVLPCQCARTR